MEEWTQVRLWNSASTKFLVLTWTSVLSDVLQVDSSCRDQTSMVTFKRVTGAMSIVVFYKGHTSYRCVLYGICSSNDVGEVRKFSPCQSLTPDPFLFLTALQVYCRTYKQAPLTPLGLFQRARQLDQLLPATISDGSKSLSNEAENYTCDKCKTSIAPHFYNEKIPVSGEKCEDVSQVLLRKEGAFQRRRRFPWFSQNVIHIDPCLISARTLTNRNRNPYVNKFLLFFLLLCTNKQTDEKCTNLVVQRKNPGPA